MDQPISKSELLRRVRSDRARFDVLIDQIPRARLVEPALPGGWSVKDVLAHISWGEREAIGVMRARALVGSDLWDLPQDERNAAVVRENAERGLDEVVNDYRQTFEEFVSLLEGMSDDELNEPERIRDLATEIPGWRPWRVLYDPDHYDDHGGAVAAAFGDVIDGAVRPLES